MTAKTKELLAVYFSPAAFLATMSGLARNNEADYTYRIDKTVYIIKEVFAKKGKTIDQLIEDLIIYAVDNLDSTESSEKPSDTEKEVK